MKTDIQPQVPAQEILSRPDHSIMQLPVFAEATEQSVPASWIVGRCVVLKDRIVNCRSYARPGMRARVRKVRLSSEGGNRIVTLDFGEFDTHNRALETSDWQDRQRVICLTAREAGEYQEVEDYVIVGDEDLSCFMEPIDAGPAQALLRAFLATGRQQSDYTSWLEERLVEACPDILMEGNPPDEAPET